MRIIVTNVGNEIMNNMSQEIIKERELKILESLNIENKNNQSRYQKSYKKISTMSLVNSSSQSNLFNNKQIDAPINLKSIRVNQKKLNIPKNISEKYNQSNASQGELLPITTIANEKERENIRRQTIRKFTIGNSLNLSAFSPTKESTNNEYSIKEILPKNTFNNMIKSMRTNEEIKNNLSRVDEKNFRSKFKDHDYIEDILIKADKKINSEKTNLIRYLNKKEKISEHFIKKISDYDNERLMKLNKACQQFIVNEEKEKIFTKLIQEKVKNNALKENEDYKKSLLSMEKDILGIEQKLSEFKKPVDDKEKYVFIHKETERKYWERYHVNNYSLSPLQRKQRAVARRSSLHFAMKIDIPQKSQLDDTINNLNTSNSLIFNN